ncbi:TRAP transporter substrate-binding protein [Synergistaceae bacterium OttesenSCG-928-I11]|nr:TRAP transporter substrate-binding protein [Synergistaceae bacterium OttesenSCG-928-I11]
MMTAKKCFVAMLLVLSAILCAAPLFAAPVVYQLSDNQPADYPTTIGDNKFAELVAERTDGRIKIDVYHSAQLFDEKSAIETAQMGGLAFCRVNAQPLSDFTPALGVLSLPYIFRDEDHLWKVLNGPIGEDILKEMEANGLVGLAYYDSGSRSFYNSKREVKTPADMKGLKIRVQQSKLMVGLVESLGASATPMAYGEVYTGLQSGVIEGAENNWPSYYSTSHYEVAKFFTLDHHTRTPEVLCMSKIVWDKLSDEDKKIIKEAAMESQATQRKAWKDYEAKSIEAIKAGGKNTITEVTDLTPWQEAVKPVYSQIDLGPKRDEYIKRIQEVK